MAYPNKMDAFTDEELLTRLKESESYQGFLEGLGYKTGRSQNVRNIAKRRFEAMGVDYRDYLKPQTSHATAFNTISDEEYYTKGVFRGSNLAKRVRKDNIFDYECVFCKNTGFWNGLPITLHLDHINGDNKNNNIDNLRWLCPNCHSQTSTYNGKNKGKTDVR